MRQWAWRINSRQRLQSPPTRTGRESAPADFAKSRRGFNRQPLLALLVLLLLAACRPAAGAPQPPTITYGQELCDACGMLIDEPRFAAATVLTNGEARKFDDIGDMLAYHAEHPELEVAAWFVHDYDTEEWLPAETALYVKSDEIMSPMAHGLAAFAGRSAAELLAGQTNGEILTFDKLRVRMNNEG